MVEAFSEESTAVAYSRLARFYDLWAGLTETKAAAKVLEMARVSDGEHVLEVAVGTGRVFSGIVKGNPGGTNEGIDISPGMLAVAEGRLMRAGEGNYHLQVGSAYDLPFDDGTFDLVVNNFMLDLLPEADYPDVLAEFSRVLKPSGRVVISTMTFGRRWYNKFWHLIAHYLPALLTGCRPISVRGYMEKAGFVDIKTEYISQNTFPSEVLEAIKG